MSVVRSTSRQQLVSAFAAASIVATLLAGTALAAPSSKPYHVDVETDSVAAGSHVQYTVRIYNDSGSPVLGSANYTVNSAFSDLELAAVVGPGNATLVGNVIQLRNLNIAAQGSKAFTYQATAPCPATDPTSYVSSINAKQSNDYKGTGNDFILDTTLPVPISDLDVAVTGSCTFKFAFATNARPADSQINTNITTETYDPNGDPIKVVLLDGTGNAIASSVEATVTLTIGNNAGCAIVPPCGTLSGDRTESTVNGVATFDRDPDSSSALKIDVSGVDYTLHAAGDVAGSVSGDSPPFNVQDVGMICGNGPCKGVTNGKQFDAVYQLDATAHAGDLLTVGVTTSVITCTALGFTPHTDTITTAFTGSGTKTLTMTFTNTNNEPKSSFRVCYSQPDLPGTWVDRFGATKSGTNESYLQDCSNTSPANTPPCVVSVDNDKKKIIIKVLLPVGDPKGRG